MSLRSLPGTTIGLAALLAFAGTTRPAPAPAAPASRPAASQPAHGNPAEMKAEVPELGAFHEVIFQLWHKAWPDKDAALMKKLLPQVKQDFAAVQAAALPGILRDKRAEWDKGLAAMAEAVKRYDAAAGGGDTQALLDAVEDLHTRFEEQSRIVRPHMKELGAYHVGLYQIYHRLMPEKQLPGLRAMADTLEMRCTALLAAEPPRWFKGEAAALKAECAALCEQTTRLKVTARDTDWAKIDAAVEAVHTQYQKVEGLFE